MTEPPNPNSRIEAAVKQLQQQAMAALSRIDARHQRATQTRAEADKAAREYAAEYRAISKSGLFTTKQLKEFGYPAPDQARQRRAKPSAPRATTTD